jgi:hypothetical protein
VCGGGGGRYVGPQYTGVGRVGGWRVGVQLVGVEVGGGGWGCRQGAEMKAEGGGGVGQPTTHVDCCLQ